MGENARREDSAKWERSEVSSQKMDETKWMKTEFSSRQSLESRRKGIKKIDTHTHTHTYVVGIVEEIELYPINRKEIS